MTSRIASPRIALLLACTLAISSCGGDDTPPTDSGVAPDAAPQDAGPLDAAHPDAAPQDAGPRDSGDVDAFVCPDSDGDGHTDIACGGDDCNDSDSSRYPGNTEVCDATGHDEDCDLTTYGADGDGDGFVATACCNTQADDTLACGTDCDDTNANVHPGAAEVCNGGIDDDCNGLADLADGVCVPCATGYTGFDGSCTDIDECLTATTCGPSRASCTNTVGSYECGCQSGYAAPATGGACADVDECAASSTCGAARASCANTPGSYSCGCALGYSAPATGGACVDDDECATASTCGAARTGCTNVPGSYECLCAPGYSAPATGGACADIDECAATVCGAGATSCINSVGSYACTCALGFTAPASGAPCVDIDECALPSTCGAQRANCVNTAGSYVCECQPGYAAPAAGGACADLNECAAPRTDDCDTDPIAPCTNAPGSFSCACPTNFAGTGHGAAGCLLTNPALSALAPSVGRLSPTFAAGTLAYSLRVSRGTSSVTLTPTVTYPTRATIRVAGVVVASGTASAPISVPPTTPLSVTVSVTTETGAVRTYTVVLTADRSHYLKASNTGASDFFGRAIALSSDGSTLAVGAPGEDSNATGVGGVQTNNTALDSGAVYVFTRAGDVWSQEAYVKASNTDAGDGFGRSVALSADGSTLAVGADGEASSATGVGGDQTSNGTARAGAVYVFARVGTTWSQEAYVKASNPDASDAFGAVLALSGSGSTLAVGAAAEDSAGRGVGADPTSNAAINAGAVYVFARVGAVWSQEAYVKASNADQYDSFGGAIALSSDGATLAVGASNEASAATGIGGAQTSSAAMSSGAAYVFTRAGTTWSQQTYVKASNTESGDRFGGSIALSSDGLTLAVGAYVEASSASGVNGDQTNNLFSQAGAAYVFTYSGATWAQQAYLKASNPGFSDQFGWAVALSSDGSALAVSASGEGSNAVGIGGDQTNNAFSSAGAVYLFARAAGVWSQQVYAKASNTEGSDLFGYCVALSGDGSTYVAGAYNESSNATGIGGDQTSNSAGASGAAYVF
jgi:hypothetical protein